MEINLRETKREDADEGIVEKFISDLGFEKFHCFRLLSCLCSAAFHFIRRLISVKFHSSFWKWLRNLNEIISLKCRFTFSEWIFCMHWRMFNLSRVSLEAGRWTFDKFFSNFHFARFLTKRLRLADQRSLQLTFEMFRPPFLLKLHRTFLCFVNFEVSADYSIWNRDFPVRRISEKDWIHVISLR